MKYDELRQHMIDEHGWPESRLSRMILDRDFCDTGQRRSLTLTELRAKHDFDHSAGFKFTAHTEHSH